ncbi:hypothetical protein FACS1894102_1850 [Spirochaetia bacterium]|nr:hypothetical protein FACS1894102_1850 [Spirochaetia bacterium]
MPCIDIIIRAVYNINMKRTFVIAFIFCVFATISCAGQQVKSDNSASGILTISNIPEDYIGGILLVSGKNSKGDTFTYSSKTLQKITGTTMEVQIFSIVTESQKSFSGNGEYAVTLSLFTPSVNNEAKIASISAKFSKGCAGIDWQKIKYMK